MSFSASAKRVRDPTGPIGLRVRCMHECLENFNLFGFQATRARLLAMTGASDDRWQESTMLAALNQLSAARDSWTAFANQNFRLQRLQKRTDRRGVRPSSAALRETWLAGYLDDSRAAAWLVSDLGQCQQCSHLMIHHGYRSCRACSVDREVPPTSRCQIPLPPPQ